MRKEEVHAWPELGAQSHLTELLQTKLTNVFYQLSTPDCFAPGSGEDAVFLNCD